MSASPPTHRVAARILRCAAAGLVAAAGLAALPRSARADEGISARIPERIMVQLRDDEPDPAAALAGLIAALESMPAFPGLTAVVLDSVPGPRLHLIGLAAPAGVDLNDLEIDETFAPWIEEGEPIFERDAPEGTTGSTWVDDLTVGPTDFGTQYARGVLGLDAAHLRSVGRGVVVAVLDTGLDVSHPVILGGVAPGGLDLVDGDADPDDSANGQDDDGDGRIDDLAGHGTYVAGLIRLVAPEARILPIRVLDDEGNGDSWALVTGVHHAIDRGVEVINLSLRSTVESPLLDEALDRARSHGISVVAAAGNLNREEPRIWPAMGDKAIGVAAVDPDDRKAGFSNYHLGLAISAPGASPIVRGSGLPDPARSVISSLPGGAYAVWEGTSMAVPLVSGTIALMRSQHPEVPADHDLEEWIRDELAATAVDLDAANPEWAGKLGAGRLDCAAAIMRHPAAPAFGDLDASGDVDFDDLLSLLAAWDLVHSSADLDGDGRVGFEDLLLLLLVL